MKNMQESDLMRSLYLLLMDGSNNRKFPLEYSRVSYLMMRQRVGIRVFLFPCFFLSFFIFTYN